MLLAMAWYHTVLAILFSFLALLLMGVILLQRGRGVGLAGAFGGAGGHTAFGSKTGDFLTWATIVVAGVFLVLAIALNFAFRPERAHVNPPAEITAPVGAIPQPPGPQPTPVNTPPGPVSTGTQGPPAQSAPPAEPADRSPAGQPDAGTGAPSGRPGQPATTP